MRKPQAIVALKIERCTRTLRTLSKIAANDGTRSYERQRRPPELMPTNYWLGGRYPIQVRGAIRFLAGSSRLERSSLCCRIYGVRSSLPVRVSTRSYERPRRNSGRWSSYKLLAGSNCILPKCVGYSDFLAGSSS
jgi:hypothetical protein